MANHVVELALRRTVAAKSDLYYEATKEFGGLARIAFAAGASGKAQIRNLENIANSASRVSDILDFVKRQSGRQTRWLTHEFGPLLLKKLDNDLKADSEQVFKEVQTATSGLTTSEVGGLHEDDRRRIHILLCREFVRHLSAHYLYALVRPDSYGDNSNESADDSEDL